MLTFNPGDHHVLSAEDCPSTEVAFGLSLFAALVQGCARCRDIAPGVTMRIWSGQPPVAPNELEDWCIGMWNITAMKQSTALSAGIWTGLAVNTNCTSGNTP